VLPKAKNGVVWSDCLWRQRTLNSHFSPGFEVARRTSCQRFQIWKLADEGRKRVV